MVPERDRDAIHAFSEDVVLGSVIASASESLAKNISSRLTADDFADQRNRSVFEAVVALSHEGHQVDPISVAERLQQMDKLEKAGGLQFLTELMDAGQPEHVAMVEMRRMQRNARVRVAEQKIRGSLVSLERGHDPEVVIQELQDDLMRLGHFAHDSRRYDDMGGMVLKVGSRLEKGALGFEWPWPAVTAALGRLVPGQMFAVSAYSSGGKSTFARNLALGLERMGVATVYYAIEEKDEVVLGLMGCALSGVSYVRYGRGYAMTPDEEARIIEAVNGIYERRKLVVNGRKLWAPHELLARTRMYAQEGTKVFIIDHAHLIDYPGDEKQEMAELGRFAERLHALCCDEDVTAIVLYQPKKPALGGDVFRPVSPDEMRGTGRVWNIAENTLHPYRPFVEVNPSGSTKIGPNGLPIVAKPYSKDARAVEDYFFLRPGKARIGGMGGDDIVLRFDSLSGLIYEPHRGGRHDGHREAGRGAV